MVMTVSSPVWFSSWPFRMRAAVMVVTPIPATQTARCTVRRCRSRQLPTTGREADGGWWCHSPSPRNNRMFLATLVLSFLSNTACRDFLACEIQNSGFSSSTEPHTHSVVHNIIYFCIISISATASFKQTFYLKLELKTAHTGLYFQWYVSVCVCVCVCTRACLTSEGINSLRTGLWSSSERLKVFHVPPLETESSAQECILIQWSPSYVTPEAFFSCWI